MGKKYILSVVIILLVAILFVIFFTSKTSGFESINNFKGEIDIYKSISCGCCEVYSNYVERKVNPKVNTIINENSNIKEEYGVPPELQTCHTTIIDGYFVEGHIPLEAIEKLLSEKPDIKGIAMPGMPSGSPGMPGTKKGDFIIYAVNYDKSYEEFMRI